ncbi:coadhesin isoform X3 [Magallana gigas]|uniref:coadhesin isoform X3 n=1 Tax=Magallana gigas TaxID=29159 RepID=UPI00334067C3
MNLLCTCLIFGLLKSNFVAARWSTWGAWGHCSVTCGTGTKVSHRTCSHGSCDGSSTKTTSCHPTPHTCPPVDGHWTAWGHWGSCSATCEGTRTRTRVCHPPEHGGAPCRGDTVETSGCGTSHCPVDGHLTEWGHWGSCSATCEGTRTRTRVCHPPEHGGAPCRGDTVETSGCGTSHCPVDGHWTAWGHWGSCSATCEGTRTRTRVCHPPEHGGAPCRGDTVETSGCGTSHCPVDGHWTAWGHWGSCSATCEGTRTRTRVCHPPEHGGAPCRGNTVETSGCGASHCPVDGYLTTWTYWSLCSATCEGTRKRIRVCHPPQYGGAQCFGGTIDISGCGASHCPVDGQLSDWGSWSQCSATCEGLKSRSRTCSHPQYGGASCDNQTTQTAKCGNEHCPVDGQLSDWGSWSQCSATCEGLKSRSRTCSHPQYGGAPCTGQTTQTAKCGTVNCPGVTCPTCNEILECTWNTSCPMSETCLVRNFPGYKFTTHCIMKDDCEIMKKLQKSQEQIYCCDDESCLQDILGEGRLSDWTSWGQCSATCEGLKSRTRTCNSQQVGDVPCIDVTQTVKCGTEHCPVDGDSLPWGDWSPCSVTCGSGTRVRSRACIPPQYGGHNCTGPLFEMNICSPVHCPTSPVGVTCPTCTENMECTWNTTCHVSENCMIRAFPGYKFTTHCIMKDDCALMKLLGKTHGQIFCCDDESCLRTILGN